MCKEDEALFDQIDVERPIKQMLMCKEDEALFDWIDVERPIKWTLMCKKKMKPYPVGSMLKD